MSFPETLSPNLNTASPSSDEICAIAPIVNNKFLFVKSIYDKGLEAHENYRKGSELGRRCLHRLQNGLFFLSFFCCFVLEISMRDAGMCDAQIKRSHTSSTRNFHARSKSFMIRFQPKRHTLKYGLFCSLMLTRLLQTITIRKYMKTS